MYFKWAEFKAVGNKYQMDMNEVYTLNYQASVEVLLFD